MLIMSSFRPHTLGSQELYLAHLRPFLQQMQSQLNAKTQTTQSLNAQLAEMIEKQRAEIEQLVAGLETVVNDLQGAVDAIGEATSNGEMRNEVLEMEEEVQTSKKASASK